MGWEALAEAGAHLINFGINNYERINQQHFASDEAKAQRSWASAEAQKSRDFQKFMYDYDSPENRKKRLLEAGYNPWFSDQNGQGVGIGASVPSGQSAGAPSLVNRDFGRGIGDTLLKSRQTDSDIALNSANVDKVNREAKESEMRGFSEFVKAYKEMYSIDKKQAKEFADSYLNDFSNEGSYFHQEMENKYVSQRLEISRNNLEYELRNKYGEKESLTKLEEIESIITRNFGELGLWSAQSDWYRQDINLMKQKVFELGSEIARNMAQAGLFTSEARTNDAIRNYVADSWRYKSGTEGMAFTEGQADFISRQFIRDWKMSEDSKRHQLFNYQQSPEGNYVNSLLNGFTSSANVSFGANYNRGFNTSKTFNTSHGSSWIYNGNQWYGQ